LIVIINSQLYVGINHIQSFVRGGWSIKQAPRVHSGSLWALLPRLPRPFHFPALAGTSTLPISKHTSSRPNPAPSDGRLKLCCKTKELVLESSTARCCLPLPALPLLFFSFRPASAACMHAEKQAEGTPYTCAPGESPREPSARLLPTSKESPTSGRGGLMTSLIPPPLAP